MYWLSIRPHSCCWADCVSRGVLFMTVTILTLNCTYKHRTSGRVYPSGSTWDSIIDFVAWGNCFYITFIVLSSQFSIYFVFQCRIPLIRLICLVFLIKVVFVHPWLLLREDCFSLLPQSPGSCPNSNVV